MTEIDLPSFTLTIRQSRPFRHERCQVHACPEPVVALHVLPNMMLYYCEEHNGQFKDDKSIPF